MSTQVQCPNDGGFKVIIEKTEALFESYEESETFTHWRKRIINQFILFLVFWPLSILCLSMVVSSPDFRDILTNIANLYFVAPIQEFFFPGMWGIDTWIWPSLCCLPLPLGTIWIITQISITARKAKRETLSQKRNRIIGYRYNYYCQLCGYRWTWQTGQPQPEVSVNPSLIAMGAQKLKEEEEARQAEIAHHVAQDILNRKP